MRTSILSTQGELQAHFVHFFRQVCRKACKKKLKPGIDTSSTFGSRGFWPLVGENDFYALLTRPPTACLPFTTVQRINHLIPNPISLGTFNRACHIPLCAGISDTPAGETSRLLILPTPDGCRTERTSSPVHAAPTYRLIHSHLLPSHHPTFRQPTSYVTGPNGKGSVPAALYSVPQASYPPLSVSGLNHLHISSAQESIVIDTNLLPLTSMIKFEVKSKG